MLSRNAPLLYVQQQGGWRNARSLRRQRISSGKSPNYLSTQNPWASMPSAVLNLLRKIDHVRSLDNMRVTALQIVADRCAGRNPAATRFRGRDKARVETVVGTTGLSPWPLHAVATALDNQPHAGSLSMYLLPARHAERPGRGYFLQH